MKEELLERYQIVFLPYKNHWLAIDKNKSSIANGKKNVNKYTTDPDKENLIKRLIHKEKRKEIIKIQHRERYVKNPLAKFGKITINHPKDENK